MCEPHHSIVQYPQNRDDDFSGGGGAPTEDLLKPSIGKGILDWFKRIKEWLHFSKLGTGHSEALRKIGTFSSLIPHETRYETRWWDRTTRLDGKFYGLEFNQESAWQAAHDYAKVVSIGSLGLLRNFLEVSIRKSEKPYMYVKKVLDELILPKGRDYASRKLKAILNRKTYNLFDSLGLNHRKDNSVEAAIKVILGLTRKRHLLNAAWADDSSLWTPGQQEGMGELPSLIGAI